MFKNLWESTGIVQGTWENYVLILVSFLLMYLAIVKKFEPLLLLPIAFGMFFINLPGAREVLWGVEIPGSPTHEVTPESRGLIWYLFRGVEWVIFPPLIFLGIGVMTDFGPLIANPKSMFLGAAAQLGVFLTFLVASVMPDFTLFGQQMGFTIKEAGAIGIIGGADGPTAIYVTQKLAPHLLSSIAIAAYSYMALIPVIQKPIMRLLITKKERAIKMAQLRKVSKFERIIFPLV
ncbi:MAG: sodium ion-translocating decarboxylase subunit beta, partial [Clostridia bacterium]|nr:sodium ion-translocating decarboxylase subunit beta [Clostridia bacterium]